MFTAFNAQPAPRYTSYPTAPVWGKMDAATYEEKLANAANPLALYFHIPFCKTMCLFCGCSVILNRKEENERRYVAYLEKEIELIRSHLTSKRVITQLHFGGGTPTKLSMALLARLFEKIEATFTLDFSKEIAIEIDPRTVAQDNGEKLKFLKQLGFNRVSFGVQDTNEKVQDAIRRRQSLEMTEKTFALARELGFKGINIDLIYGLPFQTPETFRETAIHILNMRPDRIAFFSYAKVPWLKPHQKAMKEETLPSTAQKFQIYAETRETFIKNGYVAIGMDHFALEKDSLALSFQNQTLQRNFQGYTVRLAEEMIGMGITSIGFVSGSYFQNIKKLAPYYEALDQNRLPVSLGKVLTEEDHLRKWVIHTLMCRFELDKQEFADLYHDSFDSHFKGVQSGLDRLEADGLIINSCNKIKVTPLGELQVRLVAKTFDAYLEEDSSTPKYSLSI
ncbi:MAG: oxygen-independent coproporphyrinogen III oxidase [Chlamydiales bacterium]